MGKSRKKTPAVSSISYNGGKRRANKKVRRLLKDPEVNFDKGSFKRLIALGIFEIIEK